MSIAKSDTKNASMKKPSSLQSGLVEAFSGIGKGASRHELPARVADAIRRNDELSEILVRIIQFLVFATWGILYASAPVPNPKHTQHIVLGVFGFFGP